MGIDGSEHSRGRKCGVAFGGHVCCTGFLFETARGNFRLGNTIKNGTRQSRAPLRAVAGTRAPAERIVSLDQDASTLAPRSLRTPGSCTSFNQRLDLSVQQADRY